MGLSQMRWRVDRAVGDAEHPCYELVSETGFPVVVRDFLGQDFGPIKAKTPTGSTVICTARVTCIDVGPRRTKWQAKTLAVHKELHPSLRITGESWEEDAAFSAWWRGRPNATIASWRNENARLAYEAWLAGIASTSGSPS